MRRALALLCLCACEPSTPPPPPLPDAAPRGFDHGELTGRIEAAREILGHDPCDRKKALDLGDLLNRSGDYDGAVAHVAAWTKQCGDWPRLLWVSQYAHEQAQRWPEAAATATALIRSAPTDSDFWWWRGQAEWKAGNLDQAEADLLQSMACQPSKFPAGRLGDLAREHPEHACAAAFVLQRLVAAIPETAAWATKERSDLWLRGGCGPLAGTGSTRLDTPPERPVATARGAVNGKKTTFIVSRDLGPTLLTRALAAEAQVTLKGTRVSVWFAGGFVPAELGAAAALEVGGAAVKDLPVAVVEALPEGAGGVLGLSTYVRFNVDLRPDRISLAPIAP